MNLCCGLACNLYCKAQRIAKVLRSVQIFLDNVVEHQLVGTSTMF